MFVPPVSAPRPRHGIAAFWTAAGILLAAQEAAAQTFVRITDAANPIVMFGRTSQPYTGASWIDADSDGDVDLYLNRVGLFRNNGGGNFTRFAAAIVDPGGSIGNSWADVDNDGDLDVVLAGGDPLGSALYLNQGGLTFTKVTTGPIADGLANKAWGGAFADYDHDGHIDFVLAAASGFAGINNPNRLFHNNGDGTFARQDTSAVAQMNGPYTIPTWSDFDFDGDPDLFIGSGPANNTVARDFLYRNRHETAPGWFQRIDTPPLGTDLQDGQVYNWIDYDNDGDLDTYLTNYRGTTGGMPNRLYRNDGGTFVAVPGATAGPIVTDGGSSLASIWQDFDNDGDLDCIVTKDGVGAARFYRNEGGGSFASLELGTVTGAGPHYGAASGDYDDDGRMDVYLVGGTLTYGLFRNTTANGNAWLDVRLTGTVSNRAGIGARVRVRAVVGGQPRWQMRELSAQNSFGGMNSLDAHFGLADAAEADSVVVQWPSGIVQVLTHVAARNRIVIVEDSTTPVVGALLQASAAPGAARLEWEVARGSGLHVRIQRAETPAAWVDIADVVVDEANRVRFTDPAVRGGGRYGYRLLLDTAGGLHAAGETWLEVPLQSRFGFAHIGPNPGRGAAKFEFDLKSEAPAELEFFDAAGRRVARVAVVGPAAGRNILRAGSGLGSGVFFVRLRQGSRTDSARWVRLR